jgi:hypothetical protein
MRGFNGGGREDRECPGHGHHEKRDANVHDHHEEGDVGGHDHHEEGDAGGHDHYVGDDARVDGGEEDASTQMMLTSALQDPHVQELLLK